MQQIKDIKLEEDKCISSYDVSTLFTSVPVGHALKIIKKQERELYQRRITSVDTIISLLKFFLKNTYFVFQGR